jgi:MOSC domain-containing protein YiiM
VPGKKLFHFLNEVSTVVLEGRVEGLLIASCASGEMVSLSEVQAVADRGLKGDRYFYGRGHYSHWPGQGRDVTLIEAEVLASLPASCAISAAQARRNIVTRDFRLNDRVGQFFRLGEVILYGVRLCEPCLYLDTLTRSGVMAALAGRSGLRADIMTSGVIHVGDVIADVSV